MCTDHLTAIHQRLCSEKARFATAVTKGDRSFYERQITIAKKELDSEYTFLGMASNDDLDLGDDDLLTALIG